MGAAELTRLWNLEPDNLKACASGSRIFLPSLESFLEEAVEQTDPEAQIEEEYKLINDQGFSWRALRLLARKSHHFWAPPANANQQNKKMSQGLEALIVKVGKEFPKEKGSGEEEESSPKGAKEDGELEEDGGNENSHHHTVQTNGDEEEEDELLKSGAKMENGEGSGDHHSWMDRDISIELLQLIAAKCNGKLYRKLGHELNFAEDDMASFEEEQQATPEQHCIKSIVTSLKEGKDEKFLLERAEKRSMDTDDDGSDVKKKKVKIEPV